MGVSTRSNKQCTKSLFVFLHSWASSLRLFGIQIPESKWKCKHTFVRQTSFCQRATEARRKISNVFKNTLYNLYLKMRILIYKLLFLPSLVDRYRVFIHIGKQFLYCYTMQSKYNALDTKYFINRKKWKYETSKNRTDIMKNVEQLLCTKKKNGWTLEPYIYNNIVYIYNTC